MGLNRMDNEEEAREKSNPKSNQPISLPLRRKPEGKKNKPKNKGPCRDMNEEIDQMVAKDIQPPKIEVKGKSEIGKKADAL